MNDHDRQELETAIGHAFRNTEWLDRALTHSTRQQEIASGSSDDNEKLEFLGDAVLGLAVSEYLLHSFPDWPPGKLSQSKARLVNAASLHAAALRLNLGKFLQLGRGEEKTGGREKATILADAYEAMLAAVYLDAGLHAAAAFVKRTLLEDTLRENAEALGQPDRKSALQEFLQARGLRPAEYSVVKESGPDHCKVFHVEVRVEGRALAMCEAASKKRAEQAAAGIALEQLRAELEVQHNG